MKEEKLLNTEKNKKIDDFYKFSMSSRQSELDVISKKLSLAETNLNETRILYETSLKRNLEAFEESKKCTENEIKLKNTEMLKKTNELKLFDEVNI